MMLNKPCCCINLRTGSLILGYIELIGNILAIPYCLWKLWPSEDMVLPEKEKLFAKVTTAFVFIVPALLFSLLLLVGIYHNRRGTVKAYVIFSLIVLVVLILKLMVGLIRTLNKQNHEKYSEATKDVICIILQSYFLIVIRSYHLDMYNRTEVPAVCFNAAIQIIKQNN